MVLMRFVTWICAALAIVAGTGTGVFAAEFPIKPVRLIVPFGPGGSADIVARLVAAEASRRLPQPVVVENKPGADGNIAADQIAKSAPDGYNLLLGTSTLAIVRTLTPNLPYNLQSDLAPVINIGGGAFVMVVNPQLPAKSVGEYVALAQSRPRQLNFGSAASGSSTHLAGALFHSMAGVELLHVGYKSEPQALTALLANEVQVVVASYTAAAGFLQSGSLRALAVTSAARMKALPAVPTVAESGYPGYEAGYWNGIFAAAKTPADIIDRLYGVFADSARTPQVTQKLEALTFEVEAGTPQRFASRIASDVDKWAEVIRRAKIVAP